MATSAKSALGTLLKRGDGAAPEVFTTVAEILDIEGPGLEQGTIEVTNQDSPNIKERISDQLVDFGEITFDINFLPASTGHKGLISDLVGRVTRNFKLTFTDTTSWPASGSIPCLVTKFKPKMRVKGQNSASITLQVQNSFTFP